MSTTTATALEKLADAVSFNAQCIAVLINLVQDEETKILLQKMNQESLKISDKVAHEAIKAWGEECGAIWDEKRRKEKVEVLASQLIKTL